MCSQLHPKAIPDVVPSQASQTGTTPYIYIYRYKKNAENRQKFSCKHYRGFKSFIAHHEEKVNNLSL